MKIRMQTQFVGIGFVLSPGDVTERFGPDEVKRLIAAGHATPIVETDAAAAKRQARARKPQPEQR